MTGVASGRVHCGTGRLVGPEVAMPSASERQYQQESWPSGHPSGVCSHAFATTVKRHVEQTEHSGSRFVAASGRPIREEDPVAVAQETIDATNVLAHQPVEPAHRIPGLV